MATALEPPFFDNFDTFEFYDNLKDFYAVTLDNLAVISEAALSEFPSYEKSSLTESASIGL